jgi:transglutaminase-like putative cysteine protease
MRWLKFFIFSLLGLGFLVSSATAQANENFHTTLHTTYTVNDRGVTTVNHVIKLTNKTPTMYAKQYGLKISSPSLKNVVVKNNGQVITAEVVTTTNQTSIGVTFPDEIVGEGKTRTLDISYQNPDASVLSGQVLEVLVPKLASASEYDEYEVKLITPRSFGSPTRSTPDTFALDDSSTALLITTFFPREGEGVTALFGTEQIFNLKLKYHLQNTGPNPGIAQIALPPDTPYQKVFYQQLEPRPQAIEKDSDGNWIATYEIPSQTTVEVTAELQTHLTLSPDPVRPQPLVLGEYTQDQPYWQTNSNQVQELAKKYTQPKDIYTYVVNTLSYNYDRLASPIERLGAVEALNQPDQGTCQEFTDAFVAIARAAQIPTRRLTGYAYTQNSVLRPLSLEEDILHTWPEYYDPQRQLWIPIDPTWGNTTGGINYFDQFDLNHIVFAINGQSSERPYPAGSYKLETANTKDVEVAFGTQISPVPADFKAVTRPRKVLGFIQLPGYYDLVITNQTGVAWYNLDLALSSAQSGLQLSSTQIELPHVLPYQTKIIPFTVFSDQTLLSLPTPIQLKMAYANDQRSQTTNPDGPTELSVDLGADAGGRLITTINQPIFLIALGSFGLVCTLLTGSVLVYRQKRQRSLRRKS